MKIVIDIDENVFTRLFDNGTEDYAIVNDDLFAIAKSIRNGTPLPKGRGNMTREEIIRNLKYTMEKHKNDNVDTFGIRLSDMCKDILDYLDQEPKTDTWSIKDVADTLAEHGLMTEQESCKDCIERNEEFFKKWVNCKIFDKIQAEIDREYKWIMNTRYTIHDVNIAFGYILGIIDRYRGESEGDDE